MGCKLRNSVILDNGKDFDDYSAASLNIGYCLIENPGDIAGTSLIEGNPKFIDRWNGNFYPQDDSPLIDAGYGYNYPVSDFNDTVRVDIPGIVNTGIGIIDYVDIGVFEFIDSDSLLQEPVPQIPSVFELYNYPNPFNSVTKIKFTIIAGNWAELKIYNILGQKVFEEDFNGLETESVSFTWDGKNSGGRSAASGMYFCRLEQLTATATIKMLILR